MISFTVQGIPAPGGSKRFVGMSKRTGRAILIDMGGKRNKDWRSAVALAAKEAYKGPPLTGALWLHVCFKLARPKYHFHTSKAKLGQLREDAARHHVTSPDATKLLRSTEDALKGITWVDDSQVVAQDVRKEYVASEAEAGAYIEITPVE